MELIYQCAGCQQPQQTDVTPGGGAYPCRSCGHPHVIPADAVAEGRPLRCLGCGNSDLWRQKDFPQRLGFCMVALAAILSSIAWGYHWPILALSILAGFALLDMALYVWMPDVLVCYRCRARHRHVAADAGFSPYNHELGERYRQERLRLEGQATSR